MTGSFVDAGAPRRGAPTIDRRAEDRWVGTPVRRVSLAMSCVVVVSLAIHAGVLLFAATFGEPTPTPKPLETMVELVRDPTPPKAREAAKEEAAKPGAPVTDDLKPEPPKSEPAKSEPPRAEEPKTEPPKAEPQKLEPAKPEPKAAETKPAPQPSDDAKIAEKEAALQSLRQELESLKAEQEALKAENDQVAAATERGAADKATDVMVADGIGAMPPSFSGIQLPQMSEVDGEATSYQAVVFSQLAKTKGIRRHMGMLGTAGIVFTVDASGKLVDATVAHPSGSATLDEEAMQIVTASSPFPKPPPGAPRTIAADFNFISQPEP